MLELLLVFAMVAADAVVVRGVLRRTNEAHALAGRFGAAERERVIARVAAANERTLEALLRSSAFAEEARRAEGVSIRRVRGRVHEWVFANGNHWAVRHRRTVPPRFRGRPVDALHDKRGTVVVHVTSDAIPRARFRFRCGVHDRVPTGDG
jgi:hypothetical protein